MPDYTQNLDQQKQDLNARFMTARDFALANVHTAHEILARIRREKGSFLELPITELNYAYHLATLCDKQEYPSLKNAVRSRMTQMLFDIGWIYCQRNPDNPDVVALFLLACDWMKSNKPEVYANTLAGRACCPWNELYTRAVYLCAEEELSLDVFCLRYAVDAHTPFYDNLRLAYLSVCCREALLDPQNEELIVELLATAQAERLRPLVRNYIEQVPYDDMPYRVNDAIFERLTKEGGQETLGLLPDTLALIRSRHFLSQLNDLINTSAGKISVYARIAGLIRKLTPLPGGFLRIDMGNYVVLEHPKWARHAYAYTVPVFERMYDNWAENGHAEKFWPGRNQNEIPTAREVVLALKKSNIIRLGFVTFDILYTQDLLTITRFKMD